RAARTRAERRRVARRRSETRATANAKPGGPRGRAVPDGPSRASARLVDGDAIEHALDLLLELFEGRAIQLVVAAKGIADRAVRFAARRVRSEQIRLPRTAELLDVLQVRRTHRENDVAVLDDRARDL